LVPVPVPLTSRCGSQTRAPAETGDVRGQCADAADFKPAWKINWQPRVSRRNLGQSPCRRESVRSGVGEIIMDIDYVVQIWREGPEFTNRFNLKTAGINRDEYFRLLRENQ
jgi:hypothetical protein